MNLSGPGVVIGAHLSPFPVSVDRDLAPRFARATNDPSPQARSGTAVPPMLLATQIWEAQEAGRNALIPAEMQAKGVHGEHDLVVHRPVVPGERLRVWVEGHGARVAGRNSVVTLRYVMVDDHDAPVAEQWWTTVFLDVTCDPTGEGAPAHAFPDEARERPVGVVALDVDTDMARRYAEVSGDWSPHHFDVDAARRNGYDRVFLHGLCTMALCAQAVTTLVADGDPNRLCRVAVRFASPLFLGEQLDVRVYDAGAAGYAFEAESAGTTVITHGRAELRRTRRRR